MKKNIEEKLFGLKTQAEKNLGKWLGHNDPMFLAFRRLAVSAILNYLESEPDTSLEREFSRRSRSLLRDFYRYLPPKDTLQRIADGLE